MTVLANRAPPFRIKGWHVLLAIVLFFATVVGLDAWFAVLAVKSSSGEVAANPYEAGLAFNRTLEKRRQEAALGWSASAERKAEEIVLTFKDRNGRPLDGLTVTATLTRPATEAGRRTLSAEPLGEGVYRARTGVLEGGWDLAAEAKGAVGEAFELETRLYAQ